MSELDDHPNIIKYYKSFVENDSLHILMEYASRGDLYKVSIKIKYHLTLFVLIDSERIKNT